jgi:PTS system fructose-specific IIA component
MDQIFITPDQVFVDTLIETRRDMLAFLASQAVALDLADDEQAVYRALVAREDIAATGMQHGFALPHAKDASISKPGVFVVKNSVAIPWPSYDVPEADIVIGLLVPSEGVPEAQTKLLSELAVLLMKEDFRTTVRDLEDPAAIASYINGRLDL